MMTLLEGKDLWDVEVGYTKPTDWSVLSANQKKEIKEMKKKTFLALSCIYAALHKSIFPRISIHRIAFNAWKALKEGYQGSVKVKEVKLQTLRRDFENLTQLENESMGDYCV